MTTPSPIPRLSPPGVILNGQPADGFSSLLAGQTYPDARSYRHKFGLVLPATNTSTEHELWSILFNNQGPQALSGIGLHTINVITPRPVLASAADLIAYQEQFLHGLTAAVETARLTAPDSLIMAMSLEHILHGLAAVREPMAAAAAQSGLPWATWHDAVHAALGGYNARRIGLLTPFDKSGNDNATALFHDLGYNVVATVGFSCANAQHIAHIPDWAKERAILELLATPANRLDAVVQCGTNLSLSQVTERVEPLIGIPILGINATTFWHALRQQGFTAPVQRAGRLLREF